MSVVEWKAVVKKYKGTPTKALDNVSFSIQEGEIVVLVGPNGSGKTTVMEIASGLRTPTSGGVSVLGTPVVPGKTRNLYLGVQLQSAGLPLRLRVMEAVQAVSCLYSNPGPVKNILSTLGLDAFSNKMVDSLSGGWQKRLDLALACLGCPRALILDEPTSGVDPVARAELWEYLRLQRKRGVSILVSTHDLAEAEAYADRLLVLHKGRLVLQGSANNILEKVGGEWKLRLIGVSSDLSSFSGRNKVVFLSSGDSKVALGSKEKITLLYVFIGIPYGSTEIADGVKFIDTMFPALIVSIAANLLLMGLPIYLAELRSRGVDRRYAA